MLYMVQLKLDTPIAWVYTTYATAHVQVYKQMRVARRAGLLLLRLVSEACQTSMSARVFIECHWLACTGNHLAGNHHMTG